MKQATSYGTAAPAGGYGVGPATNYGAAPAAASSAPAGSSS